MKDKILDATLVLAVITCAVYMWGLIKVQQFFKVFGISVRWLELPTPVVLTSAFDETLNIAILGSGLLMLIRRTEGVASE